MLGFESSLFLRSTQDGSYTLYHPEFSQNFHGQIGALTESRELFCRQSQLKERLLEKSPVTVLDIGLGLGYNALAAIDLWFSDSHVCDLNICSLECNEELVELFVNARGSWMQGWVSTWIEWLKNFQKTPTGYRLTLNSPNRAAQLRWNIHIGDALSYKWCSDVKNVDIFFQDAFSHTTNPGLWSERWFCGLRRLASSRGMLVTYSVARVVRDHLQAAGWSPERISAPGCKRHWLRAKVRSDER